MLKTDEWKTSSLIDLSSPPPQTMFRSFNCRRGKPLLPSAPAQIESQAGGIDTPTTTAPAPLLRNTVFSPLFLTVTPSSLRAGDRAN